jgi:hypothetical protein
MRRKIRAVGGSRPLATSHLETAPRPVELSGLQSVYPRRNFRSILPRHRDVTTVTVCHVTCVIHHLGNERTLLTRQAKANIAQGEVTGLNLCS